MTPSTAWHDGRRGEVPASSGIGFRKGTLMALLGDRITRPRAREDASIRRSASRISTAAAPLVAGLA